MRILISNEARRGGGGVESYLSSVTQALRDTGHEVALLYANPSSESGPTAIETDPSWSVRDLGLETALRRARDWRPDVCFAHNMRYLDVEEAIAGAFPTVKMMHAYAGACLSGHKAFSFPGIEVCTRACGAGCLAHFLPRRCGRLRPDVMLAGFADARRQQALFPRYAAMVVASDHMRREFERYDGLAGRVTAIPLFASGPPGTPPGARDVDVVFLGRLTPLKGASVLLDALHHAGRALGRPVRAVIAGAGPESRELGSRAAGLRAGGTAAVDLIGWIDAPARDALLARARVLALPSRWPEPFGLVGLEAARFGVPAVAFDVGGISMWLAADDNGVLVPPSGGAAGFGAAMASLLGDDARHRRLSAGAVAAASRFSATAHVSALERVLIACQSPGIC